MPDMRDELVEHCRSALGGRLSALQVRMVLGSIPPGVFKLDEKTWVKVKTKQQRRHNIYCEWPDGPCNRLCRDVAILYTEVEEKAPRSESRGAESA